MENRSIKILVIDDNKDNLISIKALIMEAFPDALILTALTGAKGLELAVSEDPDVILLDIVMPIMDGFEVCQRLKSINKLSDIPVVFVTAIKGDKESRIRALECGGEAFLDKPIEESELTAQIRAMVKIKTANTEKRNEKERLAALLEEQTRELRATHNGTLNLLKDLRKENEARRKSEEALTHSRELMQYIIEHNWSAIAVHDRDFKYLYVSQQYLKNNLIEGQNIIGKYQNEIFPDISQKWKDINQRALSGEVLSAKEDHHVKDDGTVEWTRWECRPWYEKDDCIGGIIVYSEVITERKLAEEELLKSKVHAEESDRLKSAFLANMSHEIRTPMNGILGFTSLLKEPDVTGEQQQEYIQIIEKSGFRLLNIINDLIDISKIESGLTNVEIMDSNINEIIEFIYTFFKPEVELKGMQLFYKNSLPAKKAIIKTDSQKVYNILTNLVKNAIKYSEKGSIVFGYNLVVDHNGNKELEFFVKDTGIGIPENRQEAIFERFIQADISDKMALQGAGLGLSITKAYVEMLGGKIWVESEEGKGSTFYFTLPYNTEQEEKSSNRNIVFAEEPDNQIKNLKILIAEDHEPSEMLIEIEVRMFGKEFIKARNGLEAINACLKNPDIDLILMDIQMPVLSGYDATRQIRKFNKDVIIIAQTAFGLSGDREKALEAGCNDYISKPINSKLLKNLIKKHFKK